MSRIFKDAIITKTKPRRPAAGAKMVTRRLTAEIFVSGGRRIITIRIDEKVAGHISELRGEWHYMPAGSAKPRAAIGSTEEELLAWWMRSHGFQYVEDIGVADR
ncbi:MAG: hypothetical protein J2P41_11865 [Blastocatellia bacterium]|nr:hypothetical protein [Blastocatellia bacterium]